MSTGIKIAMQNVCILGVDIEREREGWKMDGYKKKEREEKLKIKEMINMR